MSVRGRGFTLIELVAVMALLGAVAAIAIPRALKTSPYQEVDHAARRLVGDLEQVRTRAMAAKRRVRVAFDATGRRYMAYMDVSASRDGNITETAAEAEAAHLLASGTGPGGAPAVKLPKDVKYGKGSATTGPLGNGITDPIALSGDEVEFDARGMVTPLGGGGVVYLTYSGETKAVAAVTISGAGAFEVWRYRNGRWER